MRTLAVVALLALAVATGSAQASTRPMVGRYPVPSGYLAGFRRGGGIACRMGDFRVVICLTRISGRRTWAAIFRPSFCVVEVRGAFDTGDVSRDLYRLNFSPIYRRRQSIC